MSLDGGVDTHVNPIAASPPAGQQVPRPPLITPPTSTRTVLEAASPGQRPRDGTGGGEGTDPTPSDDHVARMFTVARDPPQVATSSDGFRRNSVGSLESPVMNADGGRRLRGTDASPSLRSPGPTASPRQGRRKSDPEGGSFRPPWDLNVATTPGGTKAAKGRFVFDDGKADIAGGMSRPGLPPLSREDSLLSPMSGDDAADSPASMSRQGSVGVPPPPPRPSNQPSPESSRSGSPVLPLGVAPVPHHVEVEAVEGGEEPELSPQTEQLQQGVRGGPVPGATDPVEAMVRSVPNTSPLLDMLSTSDDASISSPRVSRMVSSPPSSSAEERRSNFRRGSTAVLKTSAMTVHLEDGEGTDGEGTRTSSAGNTVAVRASSSIGGAETKQDHGREQDDLHRPLTPNLLVRHRSLRSRTSSIGGAARLSTEGSRRARRGRSHSEMNVRLLPQRSLAPPPVETPPPRPTVKQRLKLFTHRLLQSDAFTFTVMVAIMYALFGDDVRLAWFPKAADPVFYCLTIIALLLFVFEFVANLWVRPGFLCSFYFWLDLLSAVSLIPDIGWLWLAITGHEDSRATGGDAAELRAGRAARVGTRAGRIVRIVRLVRLARLLDLLSSFRRRRGIATDKKVKAAMVGAATQGPDSSDNPTPAASEAGPRSRRNTGKTNVPPPHAAPIGGATPDVDRPSQKMYISRLGRVLADLTTRRIILLVLLVVLLLPLLDPSFGLTLSDDFRFNGLKTMHSFSQDPVVAPSVFDVTVENYGLQSGRLLFLSVCPPGQDCLTTHTVDELAALIRNVGGGQYFLSDAADISAARALIDDEFRESEFEEYAIDGCVDGSGQPVAGTCEARSFVAIRHLAQKDAQFAIYKTLFVIAVIVFGALLFTRDAEVLVIRPIERMTALVVELARNPLRSINSIRNTIRQQYGHEEGSRPRAMTGRGSHWLLDGRNSSGGSGTLRRSHRNNLVKRHSSAGLDALSPQAFLHEAHFETALVENAMAKIGGLLQIGFGEAGGAIIANNMRHRGRLDCLIPGVKVDAVFGFCDIRQFTDVTECLLEEVMVFVNHIGQIVHSAVHRLGGAANKNIGDAFLLVWKLPKSTKPGRRSTIDGLKAGAKPQRSSGSSPVLGPACAGAATGAGGAPRGFPAAGGVGGVSSTTARRTSSLRTSANTLPDPTDPSPPSRRRGASMGAPLVVTTSSVPQRLRVSSAVNIPGPEGGKDRRTSLDAAAGRNKSGNKVSPLHSVAAHRAAAAKDPAVKDASPRALAASRLSPVTIPDPQATVGDHPRVGRLSSIASSSQPGRSSPRRLHADPREAPKGKAKMLAAAGRSPSFRWSGQASALPPSDTDSVQSARPAPKIDVARRPSTLATLKRRQSATGVSPRVEGSPRGEKAVDPLRRSPGPDTPPRQVKGRRRSSSWVAEDRRRSVVNGLTAMSGLVDGRNRAIVAGIADSALAAFVKVLVDIYNANHTGQLEPYSHHPLLQERFPDRWFVQLGFGMHIGWAIEGAIGSTYKIDASYLSPHVNIASRLESLTTMYRVPIILSSHFATQLSVHAQRFLRLIDRVTLKGSIEPMELYTFDVDWSNIPQSIGEEPHNILSGSFSDELVEPKITMDFSSDENLNALQSELPLSFFDNAEAGVEAYIAGDWDTARRHLSLVLEERPDDGPVVEMMRFMADRRAPDSWPGYRVLSSKS